MARSTSNPSSRQPTYSDSAGKTHHSLGLKHALRRFHSTGGSRILDLGPASGRNVQFLSRFASKLHIADLYQTLVGSQERRRLDRARFVRILSRDVHSPDKQPVDLILAWDLLNYLDREQLSLLGQQLAGLCCRDTVILSLISTHKLIPKHPTRFLIIDAETLWYDNDSKIDRPAPLYKEPDLDRLWESFAVETSFLLRNGMQEYVLTPRATALASAD